MIQQIEQLGSQSKTSMCDPKFRERKPDLVFEAPTYRFRDSIFSSTRQGGFYNPYVMGLVVLYLAMAAKVLWVTKIIEKKDNFFRPLVVRLTRCFSSRITISERYLRGGCFINSKYLHRLILSPS